MMTMITTQAQRGGKGEKSGDEDMEEILDILASSPSPPPEKKGMAMRSGRTKRRRSTETTGLTPPEKQKVSGCIPTPLGETTNITWDQVYELPTRNSGITRVQVKFEYSWLGKIVKQLFRIPPVIINVNYLDGTQANFRFLQDNSANGVILSHLPRNDQELMAFFQVSEAEYHVERYQKLFLSLERCLCSTCCRLVLWR